MGCVPPTWLPCTPATWLPASPMHGGSLGPSGPDCGRRGPASAGPPLRRLPLAIASSSMGGTCRSCGACTGRGICRSCGPIPCPLLPAAPRDSLAPPVAGSRAGPPAPSTRGARESPGGTPVRMPLGAAAWLPAEGGLLSASSAATFRSSPRAGAGWLAPAAPGAGGSTSAEHGEVVASAQRSLAGSPTTHPGTSGGHPVSAASSAGPEAPAMGVAATRPDGTRCP